MTILPLHTDIVLGATVVLLITWEVLALACGQEATISERIWHYSTTVFGPMLALLIGILIGHFFWQRKRKE